MRSNKRKIQVGKRKNLNLILASISFVFVASVLILSFIYGKHLSDYRAKASATSWVENDRELVKSSNWFITHGYSDCPKESVGYWPTDRGDCLFSEGGGGPTLVDQLPAKEPPGLYYKHFLPTDFYLAVPELFFTISYKSLSRETLEAELQKVVEKSPASYAHISVDSLFLGLEGGIGGTKVRSATLMVHPKLERPITNAIGVLPRARNLYKPFIEGATGGTISDEDLVELYSAALNRCGINALNDDQSGRGVTKIIGEYAVMVQSWDSSTLDALNSNNDCNIHVVKLLPDVDGNVLPLIKPVKQPKPALSPTPRPVNNSTGVKVIDRVLDIPGQINRFFSGLF